MTVHFIGAGPGAADLLTVRASSLVAAAPVCVYAGTYVDPDVLALCPADVVLVDTQHLDLDQIIEHLVSSDRAGLDVVRLCSGDPSVYSALAEQTRRLDAAEVAWDVTPGVPAYAAAAAALGVELTVPEIAQSVVLTRTQARSTAMPPTESLEAFAATRATLALHLAIRHIGDLADRLVPSYGADCPVAVVYRVSQDSEQVVTGTLTDIADQVEEAGLTQAAVILVGDALRTGTVRGSHLYDPRRPR